MNEKTFKSEMSKAQQMQKQSEEPEYWAGVMRGLRRGYHGEAFGNPGEHELWLSLIDRNDDLAKQRGRGYRDGLTMAGLQVTAGQPRMFDEGSKVLSFRIPESLYNAIPDPRTDWARDVFLQSRDVKKLYCTQNDGDCESCSLVSYGKDCKNHPIKKYQE